MQIVIPLKKSVVFLFLITSPGWAQSLPSEQEKILCSSESSNKLARLELHGETRFSELKMDLDSCTASAVDFAEIGADKKRKRRSKKNSRQASSTGSTQPQMGSLLTMKGSAREKTGWRDIVVHCAVHNHKVNTFTYELLTLNPESGATASRTASEKPTNQ
jgi:hypothetical protein